MMTQQRLLAATLLAVIVRRFDSFSTTSSFNGFTACRLLSPRAARESGVVCRDVVRKTGPARQGVSMVFDFFRKRAEEGVAQAKNLADAAQAGQLDKALRDTAEYVKERQAADAASVSKFSDGLAKSRMRFLGDLESLFGMAGPLDETLEKLEEALLQADLGATTSYRIIEDLRETARSTSARLEADDIKSILRGTLVEVLKGNIRSAEADSEERPTSGVLQITSVIGGGGDYDNGSWGAAPPDGGGQVRGGVGARGDDAVTTLPDGSNRAAITFADPSLGVPSVLFFMGANGMGKTTTVGKVAERLRAEGGQRVLLAAADTFRAAAVEQLEEWATRSGADIVKPDSDEQKALAVVSAAATKVMEEGYDTLIVDTSGRLANNKNLNEELKKMKRVLAEKIPGAPHDTLLVVDASVGRNAVDQARTWKKEVGVSGLVVTKLDGTARGGFVVSIASDLGVPVKLVGVGEGIDDLRDFEPELFVDSLLGHTPEEASLLRKRYDDNPVLKQRMLDKLKAAAEAPPAYVPPPIESYPTGSSRSRRKEKAKAAQGKGGKGKKRKR